MNNIYTFNQTQLKVLLRGSGYSSVAGLNINNKPLEDMSVIKALNELMSKNYIESKDSSFTMKEDIRRMINLLGISKEYAAVHSRSSELPDLCCFFGDEILVCSSRSMNENFISLYFTDAVKLFTELLDQGYLPDDEKELPLDEDKLEEYERSLFADISYNEPLKSDSRIILSVELPDRKFIRIAEYYLYNYIAYFDGKLFRRELYNGKAFERVFFELMG